MKSLWMKISGALVVAVALVVVALIVFVDWERNEATISGRFVGLNAKMVYLEKTTTEGNRIVDSVALDPDGYYQLTVKNLPDNPTLYHVVYNKGRLPLLISRGESIELRAMGNILMSYTVKGSRESQLLQKFNKHFIEGQQNLNRIVYRYKTADSMGVKALDRQYSAVYNDIKRQQISFIIENKDCLAAVYALYQRLPGDQFLTNAASDLIYYRTVLDAVSNKYPNSPFLLTLSTDIASMAARLSLMKSVEVRSYPDLKAPDMYGNDVALSSLDGNVILLDFWAAELGTSNTHNADLKDLYERYRSQGFRVYQVSADVSKVTWITAVQGQRLPWISVCDFGGELSPLLRTYNVFKLPSNYLIGRDGNIISRDLYGEDLEAALSKIFK